MKNLDKKVAVSPSTATICSADAPDGNAERETPEKLALLFLEQLDKGGSPQEFELKKKFIATKIREAVELEREACANIADDAHKDEEYGHAAFRCVQISQAIRSRTE